MGNPQQLALEKENQRLRAVIADFEERFRTRQSEERLHKHDEATLRESFLLYKEIFDNTAVCLFLLEVTPDALPGGQHWHTKLIPLRNQTES